MDKQLFVKGITFLAIAYNKEMTQEQIEVWYDFFKNDDYETFRTAVKRIIPKNQYMPSIAELKQEIAHISNPILQLNVDEEWKKVIDVIRKYGYYRSDEALGSLNEYTRKIVQTIGWHRLCTSENIEWERKTFKELFNNKQENIEDALLVNEQQLTLSEIKRIAEAKAIERERAALEYEETLLLETEEY